MRPGVSVGEQDALRPQSMARLLFVTDTPQLRGAERSLEELIVGLLPSCTVDVVVPSNGPLVGRLQGLGVAVHIVPFSKWVRVNPSAIATIRCMIRTLGASISLARLVRARDVTTVVSNTMATPVGAVAGWLARRPVVWFAREFIGDKYDRRFLLGERASLRIVRLLSDRVIACSDAIATWLRAAGIPDVAVVYSACEPEGVVRLAPDEHAATIAVVGARHPSKGQHIAVQALALLKQRGRSVRLLSVGAASNATIDEALRSLAAELGVTAAVELLPAHENPWGRVPRDAIVLVPSNHEAFSRVTIEAMKLGLAVVRSDSDAAEQIDDGRTGLLFRTGDAVDLANRVQLLIDDPSLRRKLALGGQQFAVTNFSRAKFVAAFTDAMSGLTRRS